MAAQKSGVLMIIVLIAALRELWLGHVWTAVLIYLVGCGAVRWVGRGIVSAYSARRLEHVTGLNAHVLITGANTGIGLATAEWLVELGATRVILAVRSVAKGAEAAALLNEKAGREVAVVVQMDLTSLQSVKKAAAQIREIVGKGTLDVVLNAGFSTPNQNGGTAEKLELHFGAMHVGHFVLTHELGPLLRETKARRGGTDADRARIVVLASMNAAYIVGEPEFEKGLTVPKTFNMVEFYSRAKLANVLFARGLHKRFGAWVHATSCCPGGVASDVWRDQPAAQLLFNTILFSFLRSNRDGALTTLHCLLSDAAAPGEFHADSALYKPLKPRLAVGSAWLMRDDDEADKLWKLSERFVKDSSGQCRLL